MIYPMAEYITTFLKSLLFKAENYVKRSFSMMADDTWQWKKLFAIVGILACFSLIFYYCFDLTKATPMSVILNKPRTPPICGFYHFATVGNPWKSIVYEQMLIAHASGLIHASSNIYVTGLGKLELNKTIYDIFENPKFIYEYDNNTLAYEYPTLRKLEKYCLNNNDSLVWYAHAKGASYDTDQRATWRSVMNHFVLKKWRMCHGLLTSTNYTTCGAILTFRATDQPTKGTFYAGNMWWSKCSHINQLPRIDTIDQKNRFLAEHYVTSGSTVGCFNCYYTSPIDLPISNMDNYNCSENQPLFHMA